MKTYEMVKLANETGETYSIYGFLTSMRYNAEKGFHTKEGKPWDEDAAFLNGKGLTNLVNLDNWEKITKPCLTKQQLIDIVGYDFDIIY